MQLTREEMLARFERDETCHHLDGFMCARCAGGFKWFPRVTIEKYSPDQSAYALAKMEEQRAAGRRPFVSRFGLDRIRMRPIPVHRLHGDFLRELFPAGPEDGYAYDAGNSLVNTGLNNVVYLLTHGTVVGTPSGTAGQNNLGTSSTSVVGVGSGATFALTDTHLAADNTAGAYYQSQDATFPQVSTGTGLISGQSTFGTSVANFNWTEWCWATGSGTITAGSALASVFAAAASLLNHKVPAASLGSKASGASWVFTQTIQFS